MHASRFQTKQSSNFAFIVAQPGIGGLFYSAVTFQLQRKPIKRAGVARDVRVLSDVSQCLSLVSGGQIE